MGFLLLQIVFLCFGTQNSHAAATNSPPSILAKVVDIQDYPSVAEVLAYTASRVTWGLTSGALDGIITTRKSKLHPTANDLDVISFCTCPAVNTNIPAPNGTQNISSSCRYSGPESSLGVKIVGAVLGTIQQMMNGVAKRFYEGLIQSGRLADIFNAALALYLTIYGIMITTGMMSVQSGDVMNRLIKIAIVWALINPDGGAWTLFSEYFGNFFQQGVIDMVNFFATVSSGSTVNVSSTSVGPLVSFLNLPFNLIFSIKFMVMMASLAFIGPYGFVMFIILLIGVLMFLWMVVSCLMTFLKGLIGLYIMLGLAPIFISFFLFKRTREMFNAWINQVITFFLQPILVFAFLGFFIAMFSGSLHRIVDKTEYCYVRFQKLAGGFWDAMWFRPAVLFDQGAFNAQDSARLQPAQQAVTSATSAARTPQEADQLVMGLIFDSTISYDDAYGLIRNGTINRNVACSMSTPIPEMLPPQRRRDASGNPMVDATGNPLWETPVQARDVNGRPIFTYTALNRDMVNNSLLGRGQPDCNGATASAGAGAAAGGGGLLYAYRGGWGYHGPMEDFTKATGRYPKPGKEGNDFPIDSNDVFFFMLIVFLAWRYSSLVAEIASRLGDGISNATSADDVRKWFNSNVGLSYVGKGLNNSIESMYNKGGALLTSMASFGLSKAGSDGPLINRPELVNPRNPKPKNTNNNPSDNSDKDGSNPDLSNPRKNNANEVPVGPLTKEDSKVNDDTYWAMVNARSKKTLEEIKGQASLIEPGQHRELSKEQKDLLNRIDNEMMSKEKMQRIMKAQSMKLENRVKEFVRNSDNMGEGKAGDQFASDVTEELLNDAAIIQRIEQKLK
jgi:hypothetical protein